jgi:glycosyltransferase involved in cell wall biosynthesis
MRVSGFTFVRNGVELTYPFEESIRSLLPLVDTLVINVPQSSDNTLERVKAIPSDKITVFESDWDDALREGGKILAQQTNRALERCTGDWAVYLQADEVLHEDDIPVLRQDMRNNLMNRRVDGISLRYLHFEGGYWQTNPFRYRRQVRIIRNSGEIESVGDACGFARKDGRKMKTRKSRARVFHYGWARDPGEMVRKNRELEKLYHDDDYIEEKYAGLTEHQFDTLSVCREFTGSHPAVMKSIVDAASGDVLIPRKDRPYFLRGQVWKLLLKKWGVLR